MNKLTDKKRIKQLIFLCSAAYFISYLARINYAAVVSAFVAEEGLSKDYASLPVTALFISYGIGQLISGYIGDRIAPRKIITFGYILATAMNFIMPFAAPNVPIMIVVWCLNGFAHAMMWPPLVKIMTCAFEEEVYRRACVLVSYGSSAGTIAVYLLAPACVTFSGWRLMFFISGSDALIMAVIWNIALNALEREGMPTPVLTKREKTKADESTISGGGTPALLRSMGVYLLLIMLAIIMQGMIRDGVTTWMPSLINETYHLGSSISILSGVVLPIFAILSFEVTSVINRKLIRNELACAAFVAGVSCICAIILYFLNGKTAIGAVILCAVIVACMHGVNLILICMLPASFSRFGNVSFVSGFLNFGTYVGSAASTYGMARISEYYGWNATLLSWVFITLACTMFCVVCIRKWTRFTSEK
ncbi:MAG: MFS transporter [Clostridia bacterium]|nr:MFS transporter [Clostridia bacterium]